MAKSHGPLDLEGIIERLLRGARGAQRDADRIAKELLRSGHMSEAEVRAALDGVAAALEQSLTSVEREWLSPLADAASDWLGRRQERSGSHAAFGPSRPADLVSRLERIEARLSELERRPDPDDGADR